jgi:hypothetical protein
VDKRRFNSGNGEFRADASCGLCMIDTFFTKVVHTWPNTPSYPSQCNDSANYKIIGPIMTKRTKTKSVTDDLEVEKQVRRVTAMVPEELVLGMEEVAEFTGGTISEVLREAISQYLFNGSWSKIGGVAEKAILAGKTNEEVLADVFARFPDAATTLGSISWYRSKLRKEHGDEKVKPDAAIKRLRERLA